MEFDGSTCELEISEVMEGADKHLVRWRSSDFEVMVEDRCTGRLRLVEEGNTETKIDKMMMVEDRNTGEPVTVEDMEEPLMEEQICKWWNEGKRAAQVEETRDSKKFKQLGAIQGEELGCSEKLMTGGRLISKQ